MMEELNGSLEQEGQAAEKEMIEESSSSNTAENEYLEALNETIPSRSRSDGAKDAIRVFAQHLIEAKTISEDVVTELENHIAAIDQVLSDQISEIIHHADFRKLEGSWRGLNHLVTRTITSDQLKIRVMNISKKEIGSVFKKFKGTRWVKSPLHAKIYEEAGGMPGGEPFGAIIGDYEFDHSQPDIEVLKGIGQLAATAHAPFLTGTAPTLFDMDSWQDLADSTDLPKLMAQPQYAAWRSLRESEDSRYIGMCMPRFLTRIPYSVRENPVDGFDFEESVDGTNPEAFSWGNAAYAMGANVTRAFTEYGWCAQIRGKESGGEIEELPVFTFPTDDGGQDMTCPTEIAISMAKEKRLADLGLMPLSHWQNTDTGAFVGAQSLHKPVIYKEKDAAESEMLSSRLPYIFCASRFSHYLKRMVYDMVGRPMECNEMEVFLSNWIADYVHPNPANASMREKARKPLAEAKVVVKPIEGNPGAYEAQFQLRPHFQLEELHVGLQLVSEVPSGN